MPSCSSVVVHIVRFKKFFSNKVCYGIISWLRMLITGKYSYIKNIGV